MKNLKQFESIFDEYTSGHAKSDMFITDSGEQPVKFTSHDSNQTFTLPRYGVWAVKGHRKPTVIDTHDNLEFLLMKHDIPRENVYKEEDLFK